MWEYCGRFAGVWRGCAARRMADVRVMHMRQRDLTTKNGHVGTLGQSESIGLGIRVIAQGAWGFASTDVLTREGVAGLRRAGRGDCQGFGRWQKRRMLRLAHEAAYVD